MSDGVKKVDILIAIYNGGSFLEDLFACFQQQSDDRWHLIFYDDCSTDQSVELICEHRERLPDKITLLPPEKQKRGARGSFSRLLEASKADYVMFCDQDDVWLSDKIEKTFERMLQAEARHGMETPTLIHTDLKVVGSSLDTLSDSFWTYQNIYPQGRESLNRLLPQNVVTGCTVMINASLRDMALPIPQQAIMHDWWLALVAAAFGRIEHIVEATILYRQHGKNEIGAKCWSDVRNLAAVASDRNSMKQSLLNTQVQAEAFLARYSERLSPEQRRLVATYASLRQYPKPVRLYNLLKYKYFKAGLLRNLGLFARI